MKRYIRTVAIIAFSALSLAGCGGGGSSPATKATTKIYLFGNITSAGSVVSTVKTTMNIPAGVLLNYTSAALPTGLCTLKKGVIVPSGPVLVSASDFSDSTYDPKSGVLTINFVNSNPTGTPSLKSGATGNGKEIATVNFSLATPGVLPASMPEKDTLAEVGRFVLSPPTVSYPVGSLTNFATTYH